MRQNVIFSVLAALALASSACSNHGDGGGGIVDPPVFKPVSITRVSVAPYTVLNRTSTVVSYQVSGDVAGCSVTRIPSFIPKKYSDDQSVQPQASVNNCQAVQDNPGSSMPLNYDSTTLSAFSTYVFRVVGKGGDVQVDSVTVPIKAVDGADCSDLSLEPSAIPDTGASTVTVNSRAGILTSPNESSYQGTQFGWRGQPVATVKFLAPNQGNFFINTGRVPATKDDTIPETFKINGEGGITCVLNLIVKASAKNP